MKYVKAVEVDVDVAELVYGRDPEDLADFIIDIDDKCANPDLTARLYEHFSKLYEDLRTEGYDLKES